MIAMPPTPDVGIVTECLLIKFTTSRYQISPQTKLKSNSLSRLPAFEMRGRADAARRAAYAGP